MARPRAAVARDRDPSQDAFSAEQPAAIGRVMQWLELAQNEVMDGRFVSRTGNSPFWFTPILGAFGLFAIWRTFSSRPQREEKALAARS